MTAAFPADSSRVIRLTLIGLLAFSVLQVCWWLVDQTHFAEGTTHQVRALYAADLTAARRLEALGAAPGEIAAIFPHIGRAPDGGMVITVAAAEELEVSRHSHIKRYTWESGFFLVVLAACIGALWRGLREEREIRRQQDNFLALVSHQFKTPLASLRLSAETFVKRQPPPDYARELSQRMIDDVVRLEDMVTKILDSARLERGRVQFQKTQVDLNGAAQQIITRLEDTARSHGVILESAIPTGLTITADPLAVDTVLRNLLENAIAASGNQGGNQGGSQGGDQTGRVTLSARSLPDDDEVEVTVVDTGVGFPQADGDRQANGGTGLGLFIVARIMHFAGGRAEAVSAGPGKGAAFSVTWPAGPAS
jgi:signal transduction histidine kinase